MIVGLGWRSQAERVSRLGAHRSRIKDVAMPWTAVLHLVLMRRWPLQNGGAKVGLHCDNQVASGTVHSRGRCVSAMDGSGPGAPFSVSFSLNTNLDGAAERSQI